MILEIQRTPDRANVWRPPAATELILMPGSSFTKQGGAKAFSSDASGDCPSALFVITFLLFITSSAPSLPVVLHAKFRRVCLPVGLVPPSNPPVSRKGDCEVVIGTSGDKSFLCGSALSSAMLSFKLETHSLQPQV